MNIDRARLSWAASLILTSGLIACGPRKNRSIERQHGGGAGDAGVTAGTGSTGADQDAGAFAPAPHEPFPTVASNGGPVLRHVELVTLAFDGYAYESQVQAWGDWIASSRWLTAVGRDYGVSTGAHLKNVVLAGPAPAQASDASTQALLVAKIQDGTLPSPSDHPDILYVVFYPASTAVTNFDGSPGCSGSPPIGGYHWEARVGSAAFPYAVLPTCSADPNELAYLEGAAGHELIEAATDPFPHSNSAFTLADPTSAWNALLGEVADLCEGLAWTQESGFWAPPAWSPSAASAGGGPCVPAPDRPYYNTTATPASIQTVASGQSVTFNVNAWSTAPVTPWGLSVDSWGDFDPQPVLSKTSIDNGETTILTLRVPSSAARGQKAAVLIYSVRSWSTFDLNFWPVEVEVR